MNEDNTVYESRPVWQWILLYVIAGAIVYGIIYYFFFVRVQTTPEVSTEATSTAVSTTPIMPPAPIQFAATTSAKTSVQTTPPPMPPLPALPKK